MEQNMISQLEKLLPLVDQYGLAYIVALVLLIIVISLVRAMVRGRLVPRELLDRAEEDRDRLQTMLDKERRILMKPIIKAISKPDKERLRSKKL